MLGVLALCGLPAAAAEDDPVIECRAPVAWRIGIVDAGFDVDRATLRRAVITAAERWNGLGGRRLFVEDRNAGFTINLRYGQRQMVAKEIHGIRSEVERRAGQLDEMRHLLEGLVRDYGVAAERHRRQVAGFNAAAARFETRADAWQRRPGTDKQRRELLADQAALKELQTALASERGRLETRRAEIEGLHAAVNARTDRHNQAIGEANDVMQALPDQARQMGVTHINGPSTQIVLYQVYDAATLHLTLLHELGHALGIRHTEDPASIMYARNNPQTPRDLTETDLRALRGLCG